MKMSCWCKNAASTHTEMTLSARSSTNLQVLPTENVPFVFNLDLCMKPDPLIASTTKFTALDITKECIATYEPEECIVASFPLQLPPRL